MKRGDSVELVMWCPKCLGLRMVEGQWAGGRKMTEATVDVKCEHGQMEVIGWLEIASD